MKPDMKITFDSTKNMNMKEGVWKTGVRVFQIMIILLNLELRTVQTSVHTLCRRELLYATKIKVQLSEPNSVA